MIECYILGVAITGISVGCATTAPIGWAVIGLGLIGLSLMAYLEGDK